ncbi:MAG: carboxymuconolactone decarboxylase family protein [Betaproteobacteria bacterium]
MSRLAAVPREALPEDQRRFYDAVKAIRRGPVSGPFIVTMNSSPDLAARIAHLGHYFHARGQADESILPLRVRAFVALVGSRALDAPYEWAAWVNWALEAGVPQDTVDAIREDRTPASLTSEEALIARFCSELTAGDHRLSDDVFQSALARYRVQGVVELAMTLGYFAMIALPLNAFEMEMTAEQKSLRKPFAPLEVRPAPTAGRDRAPSFGSRPGTPRVPLLSGHADVPPEHQHFLDRIVRTRGWIPPAFQVLLHTPDAAERAAHIGAYLLYESGLTPATRALVALIAARALDCDYLWTVSAHAAQDAKVDSQLVTAIERGRLAQEAGSDERALLHFCGQLLGGNHHMDEAAYQAALKAFGVAGLIQISVTLGYFVMMALIVNAFEVSPPADSSRPAL